MVFWYKVSMMCPCWDSEFRVQMSWNIIKNSGNDGSLERTRKVKDWCSVSSAKRKRKKKYRPAKRAKTKAEPVWTHANTINSKCWKTFPDFGQAIDVMDEAGSKAPQILESFVLRLSILGKRGATTALRSRGGPFVVLCALQIFWGPKLPRAL